MLIQPGRDALTSAWPSVNAASRPLAAAAEVPWAFSRAMAQWMLALPRRPSGRDDSARPDHGDVASPWQHSRGYTGEARLAQPTRSPLEHAGYDTQAAERAWRLEASPPPTRQFCHRPRHVEKLRVMNAIIRGVPAMPTMAADVLAGAAYAMALIDDGTASLGAGNGAIASRCMLRYADRCASRPAFRRTCVLHEEPSKP